MSTGLHVQALAALLKIIKKSHGENVSQLNPNTPVRKAWNMVRKISGKQTSSSVSFLTNSDGSKCTEREDIVNSLGAAFRKNSSSTNHSEEFKRFKMIFEKSLSKLHDTAVEPDDTHYQILKHLPHTALSVLLDIFNDIWVSGNLPDSRK